MGDRSPGGFSVRLKFAALRTRDLARAAGFYERVLGLERTREEPGDFLQWAVGGAEICVDLEPHGREPELIFGVRGFDALLDRLREESVAFEGPYLHRGRRVVTVRDPDQNALVFEEEL